MSLPKLTVPTFKLTIPSTKKKVVFRPFLSKEEKILMLVKQSEDSEMVLDAMRDIIDVCTFKKLDVNKLAIFDIEYIFLRLRAKSVGEVIEIDMKCTNTIKKEGNDDRVCGAVIPFMINIDEIKVNTPEDHTNIIMLEESIGITMRYPTILDVKMIEDNADNDIDIIKELIVNIFDNDNVYDINDQSKEEFNEFIDNISTKQIEDIRTKFFYTMPSIEHQAKYKCPVCDSKGEYTFKGINDFF